MNFELSAQEFERESGVKLTSTQIRMLYCSMVIGINAKPARKEPNLKVRKGVSRKQLEAEEAEERYGAI